MKIPVFVSCPTSLNDAQEASRKLILRELERYGLEPRALGRSDYPTELPLREVYVIAKKCSGGVILGFEQFQAPQGISKRGSDEEKVITAPVSFPTAWNHLEAGIIYSLGLPTLVFKEEGISGGVFDSGVTDVFVHRMPDATLFAHKGPDATAKKKALSGVFLKWQGDVRRHYYA